MAWQEDFWDLSQVDLEMSQDEVPRLLLEIPKGIHIPLQESLTGYPTSQNLLGRRQQTNPVQDSALDFGSAWTSYSPFQMATLSTHDGEGWVKMLKVKHPRKKGLSSPPMYPTKLIAYVAKRNRHRLQTIIPHDAPVGAKTESGS